MAYRQIGVMKKWIGLSTDTKPTDSEPGDEFFEYDTGTTYVRNTEGLWTHKDKEV